jgi:hypothetical protein
MTVTEVTTSIAIVGGAALVGLLLLPQRLGRRLSRNNSGRFTVSHNLTPTEPPVTSRLSLISSGRTSTRIVSLVMVAIVSGVGLGITLSLLLLVVRGATGLSAS